jgi:hypothetical protein
MAALDLRRCKPGPGTTGAPTSIDEAVALANSLPSPATAECFIESLDRPLGIEATFSKLSVQPADGERSPRIFVWTSDSLVMTIVLDGPGRNLVEFGQFVSPRRSIKAEIEFPLTHSISPTEPYDRVRNDRHPEITSCLVCHDDERDEPSIPHARSSLAVRPHPNTLVDIGSLATEREQCNWDEEPQRCVYLDALLGRGKVEYRAFDASLSLF